MPPTVSEALRFEPLSVGELGSRCAFRRWIDGAVGEALRWYDNKILSPVDHVGRQ